MDIERCKFHKRQGKSIFMFCVWRRFNDGL
nr:MAG TPA: hypothetical protein [Caudoviricetes sp.]